MTKKCMLCKGHLRGPAYMIAKVNISEHHDDWAVRTAGGYCMLYHPECYIEMAGKEFLVEADKIELSHLFEKR